MEGKRQEYCAARNIISCFRTIKYILGKNITAFLHCVYYIVLKLSVEMAALKYLERVFCYSLKEFEIIIFYDQYISVDKYLVQVDNLILSFAPRNQFHVLSLTYPSRLQSLSCL